MRISLYFFLACMLFLQAGCSLQQPTNGEADLAHTVDFYAPSAQAGLKPYFRRAAMLYPPEQIALLIFKREKKLELWANNGDAWVFIKTYPVLAVSGGPGPKLREGDKQVPEGIYKIIELNPHSHFHLSLELDYPNAFDRQRAIDDHRYHLGEDIFIHGDAVSIGCIAVGNKAIEELFVLVYKTGVKQILVIIAPNDLRHALPVTGKNRQPRWLPLLYLDIRQTLIQFQR